MGCMVLKLTGLTSDLQVRKTSTGRKVWRTEFWHKSSSFNILFPVFSENRMLFWFLKGRALYNFSTLHALPCAWHTESAPKTITGWFQESSLLTALQRWKGKEVAGMTYSSSKKY